jgi:hypothetical protein
VVPADAARVLLPFKLPFCPAGAALRGRALKAAAMVLRGVLAMRSSSTEERKYLTAWDLR